MTHEGLKRFRIIQTSHVIPYPHSGSRDTQGASQTPSVGVVELGLFQRPSLEMFWDNPSYRYMLPALHLGLRKGDRGKENSQDPTLRTTRIGGNFSHVLSGLLYPSGETLHLVAQLPLRPIFYLWGTLG